jgi:transcription elongation factor GreA
VVTPTNVSFTEALAQFVAAKKNTKKPVEGQQEIRRFITWFGRERTVRELTPSEVADYAQYAGSGGFESAQRLAPVKLFLGFLKDQGMVDNSLAPHLRIPRTRKTTATGKTASGSQAASSRPQLSQEGYDRLKVQLEDLKVDRVRVVEDIKRAMEDKDFRENSPLDAAKEEQGIIESKIRDLESSLTQAEIIGKNSSGGRAMRIVVGTKVTLKDAASGRNVDYTLVDVREADVAAGKISTASPVGQALLDKSVGDQVAISVPKGTLHYTVEKIGA